MQNTYWKRPIMQVQDFFFMDGCLNGLKNMIVPIYSLLFDFYYYYYTIIIEYLSYLIS